VVETAGQPIADAVTPPSGGASARDGQTVVLDRYRLIRRIGSGGFGTVWLAHDERLDRAVAVKRIPVEGKGARTRAEREALAAARLSHHGVVALYEAGHDDDAVYLVSELVRGRTLGRLLADGELSDRDAVEVGIALCEALDHAHGRGVIHRDVKPGNVIVPDERANPGLFARAPRGAKLTDFGIARVLGDDALTATGDVVGTIAYMAPEQAEGKPVTEAADLYAAALVTYEALAGVNPIRQPGAAATARRVGVRLPPLARLRADLPGSLCRAIDRAVAPDPDDRGTLLELRDGLQASLRAVDDTPGTIAPARVDVLADHTARAAARVEEWTGVRAWPSEPARYGERDDDEDETWDEGYDDHGFGNPVVGRVAAAVAAGGLATAVLAGAGPAPPASALLLGLGAAVAVAVAPRVGWILSVLALLVWLGIEAPGVAVLVAAAALPVPTLLPWRGTLWSAPAGGALLGLAGLGPAWPAIAGQSRHVLDRAALGALGCWWALLAQPLLGRSVLADVSGLPKRSVWTGSAAEAVQHVLVPLCSSGAVALVVVWAVAAAVLPLLVRGRSFAADALAAGAWAVGSVVASGAILHAVDPSGSLHARGLVGGAAVAAALAVGARAIRGDA
jgi:tRNA A-37 threonylcarbamoyl transferase component Bud32